MFAISILAVVSSSSVNTTKLQFWAAVGAAAGVALFVRGFILLREKRIILNTPFSKIRSAAMGLVEVSGMAKGPQTIPAGITGEACYYYRAIAWQLRGSGNSRQWKKIVDESCYVPFFVDDSTASVLVNPQGAELDVHCNFKDELGSSFFSSSDMTPENIAKFCGRNGICLSERTRLEEYCIPPNYPLFALGTLAQTSGSPQWTPAPHAAANSASLSSRISVFGPGTTGAFRAVGLIPGLKVETPSAGVPLVASRRQAPTPAPAASSWSSVSMEESAMSAKQFTAATQRVTSSAATATADPDPAPPADGAASQPTTAGGFDLHPPVFLGKGASGDPFMISQHSQREVVKSLAWKSALCIWGGPALTAACLYFLALTLGWT